MNFRKNFYFLLLRPNPEFFWLVLDFIWPSNFGFGKISKSFITRKTEGEFAFWMKLKRWRGEKIHRILTGGGRFKGERERERVRKNGSVLTLRLWKIWEDELRLDKFWGRKGEWRFEEFESALNYEDIGNIFEFALKFTMGQNNVGLDCG